MRKLRRLSDEEKIRNYPQNPLNKKLKNSPNEEYVRVAS